MTASVFCSVPQSTVNLLSIYTSLEMPEQFGKALCFTITLYTVSLSIYSKNHLAFIEHPLDTSGAATAAQ